MRARQRFALLVAVAATLCARDAAGDIYRLKSPSELVTQKGSKLSLPPGYFLDEQTWQDRDAELKRLQEQETRLKAENRSLRKTVEIDAIPWKTIACAMLFGAGAGIIGWQMATK